jgi:hypothetical protein
MNALDVLFVASNWAAEVARNSGVTAPIEVVQPGVDLAVFHPRVEPFPIKKASPNTTVFFNAGKWSLNKGSDVVIDSFSQAFTPNDDVLLVMACFNPLQFPGFDGPAERQEVGELRVGLADGTSREGAVHPRTAPHPKGCCKTDGRRGLRLLPCSCRRVQFGSGGDGRDGASTSL